MKKLLVVLIILILLFVSGCDSSKQVKINEKVFNVEIADNQIERAQGLMFRNYLEEDSGMLFIFQEENFYGFWMKNTLIPLDIIWINENKEIVFIKRDAQLCNEEECSSIIPDKKARYVLEINSNLTEKYNIKIGDKIEIS
ncbi:DUF192 domain-containing protein [Candidatus Woesearchaeota archaeon]|nr:DUF192 domain-containing protein [Candidatus Woesearchaeota archaeon]